MKDLKEILNNFKIDEKNGIGIFDVLLNDEIENYSWDCDCHDDCFGDCSDSQQ